LPPNRWLTEEVKAADLLERLAIMMRRADGFVAVRGGIGTLSEVTLAWSLLPWQGGQTRSFRRKPLILLGDDWQPVVGALRQHTDLGSSIAGLARVVSTPAEVVAALASEPLPAPPGPPPRG
jgi:predicted Rossmann-fold nucleotide-binding protein